MRAWNAALMALLVGVLVGCGDKKADSAPADPAKSKSSGGARPTLITVATAEQGTAPITEDTVGWIEARATPLVAAEVSGRVLRLHADVGDRVRVGQVLAQIDVEDERLAVEQARSEVRRLEVTVAQRQRELSRLEPLARERLIPAQLLDDARANRDTVREELSSAQARLNTLLHNQTKGRVVAPVDGVIEARPVSMGEYIEVGKPLFQLTGSAQLRVHLPFPEHVASRLRPGQRVLLSLPGTEGSPVEARLTELRASVDSQSHAVDALVELTNPGLNAWRPGGSVNAQVVIQARAGVVSVPEESVVLRPAGEVVYVVSNSVVGNGADTGKVSQRLVTTGARWNGRIELRSGLKAGEVVARDGAGYLTDGAVFKLADAPKNTAPNPAPQKP